MDALTINGGVWLALSKGSGEMEDYDWLIVDSADWTHYSLSDVDIESGYIFDLNVAWDFQLTQDLVARAMVGYKQNGWEWKDRGQYLLYPEYGYVPQDLGGEIKIVKFARFVKGEGLEKRADDFAAEVASMVK